MCLIPSPGTEHGEAELVWIKEILRGFSGRESLRYEFFYYVRFFRIKEFSIPSGDLEFTCFIDCIKFSSFDNIQTESVYAS
ncbi:MAG: hypothetical protein B7X03_03565 [Parcubacteria group bacterium 21-58-10]|nr:MAG: hypothetical protein B7X03_03565 [Parcubacteria group bacterium 21-58-10]